jgi:hypothetical protein
MFSFSAKAPPQHQMIANATTYSILLYYSLSKFYKIAQTEATIEIGATGISNLQFFLI